MLNLVTLNVTGNYGASRRLVVDFSYLHHLIILVEDDSYLRYKFICKQARGVLGANKLGNSWGIGWFANKEGKILKYFFPLPFCSLIWLVKYSFLTQWLTLKLLQAIDAKILIGTGYLRSRKYGYIFIKQWWSFCFGIFKNSYSSFSKQFWALCVSDSLFLI